MFDMQNNSPSDEPPSRQPPTEPELDPETIASARRTAQYNISMGKDQETVIAQVMQKHGLSREVVEPMVEEMIGEREFATYMQQRQQQTQTSGPPAHYGSPDWNTEMIIGALAFVVGMLITVGSFVAAVHAGGGQYVMSFGLIFGGAATFLFGIYKMNR